MLRWAAVIGMWLGAVAAAEIAGNAFVLENGQLRIHGQTIQLYGIYIPPTASSCHSFERPPHCGSRAELALSFKIQDFVHCDPIDRTADGAVIALCRSGGEDLSAYLLESGWALALPDAPFEYVALERIAQQQGRGVWGLPVEPAPRPRR